MDDIAALVPIHLLGLDEGADMVKISADLDAAPAVSVLTRLNDPERGAILGILLQHVVLIGIIVSFDEFLEFSIALTLLYVVS